MRWEGRIACMDEIRNEYKIFIWETEGKEPLG
jgi:hypothetical protein